jgi:hypothetical protein
MTLRSPLTEVSREQLCTRKFFVEIRLGLSESPERTNFEATSTHRAFLETLTRHRI